MLLDSISKNFGKQWSTLARHFVADLGKTAQEAASERFSDRRFRSARTC